MSEPILSVFRFCNTTFFLGLRLSQFDLAIGLSAHSIGVENVVCQSVAMTPLVFFSVAFPGVSLTLLLQTIVLFLAVFRLT